MHLSKSKVAKVVLDALHIYPGLGTSTMNGRDKWRPISGSVSCAWTPWYATGLGIDPATFKLEGI